MTATELKNSIGDVFDRLAREGAVAVCRHDKPRAVLLSLEEYTSLAGEGDPLWLEELKGDYMGMLDRMQDPEQKAAAERAFNATPEELGEAAVRGAQRMIKSGQIKL